MVSDCGKPDWVKMEYTVLSIEGKNPKKPNEWHPRLVGKRCAIDTLYPRVTGHLWIEGLVEWEEYSAYHTTPVLSIEDVDGVLTVETVKSVYKFARIERCPGGDTERTV